MINLDMNTILAAINNHAVERQQENAMLMALMGMAQQPVQQNYQQPATQQTQTPAQSQQAPTQKPQQKKAQTPAKQKPTTVCGMLADQLKVVVGAITSIYKELVASSNEETAKKIMSTAKKAVDAGRIRKYDAFKKYCKDISKTIAA